MTTTDSSSSSATLVAAREFRRRTLLRAALYGGAALSVGPFVARSALSSSGEVNVFAWGDYVQDNIKRAFEDKTGIRLNLSTYGSNEECENKLRAAGGKGFDIIFPRSTPARTTTRTGCSSRSTRRG